MEKKSEINRRREAIKDLIQAHEISDQEQLVELLRDKCAIETNQAVISRDLKHMSIIKRPIKGRLMYELPGDDFNRELLRLAIVDVQHNESMIVVQTVSGLAAFVGDYLDMQEKINILGTLAGENVVFVVPVKTKRIQTTFSAVCKVLYFKTHKE